ncbi:hypothetical protein HCA69_12315 [Listeria grandensis]|uniref:Uncharacterized protein n=1 Tax=Listeria grandensis TaxID=1494963 RepID=A0A7X0Y517_9LIST|nr:hypothetical protein [Listeria grandensis]MBC1937156.1 hypothetical protein [Listeria grandensis]
MEINIKITSAEDVAQAQKIFEALTGKTEQVKVEAPTVTKPKSKPKTTPKKQDKPVLTIDEVQERVDELDAKGLGREIISMYRDHFKTPLREMKPSQYPEVLERLALIEKIAEDDAAFEETEAPTKTVTKAELEAKFKELLDDHRAKLKELLAKFEAQKLSNLDASQYAAFYEELEAI